MGEFESINKAGLLVQAAEATDSVDDLILFLEGFSGHRVVEFIEGLLDFIGIVI